MGSWKEHVRAGLRDRDRTEKAPFTGVFTSLSRLEERFETRKQILEDIQSRSSRGDEDEAGGNTRLLQLRLRESQHLAEKLSQTVSDLTAVMRLKEAELQHWQSRISRHRQEALTLARGSEAARASLSERELTVQRQAQELVGLQAERRGLRGALARAQGEKEDLLQRWMEEKKEEAQRLNKYNDARERWQRLAKHLRKHLRREMRKRGAETPTPPPRTRGISGAALRQKSDQATGPGR